MFASGQTKTIAQPNLRPVPPFHPKRSRRPDAVLFGNSAFSISRLFLVAYVISYVLLPLGKYFNSGLVCLPQLFVRSAVPMAVLWAGVGLVPFLLGYSMSIRGKVNSRLSRVVLRRSSITTVWVLSVIALATIVGFILTQYDLETLVHGREQVMRGQGITMFLWNSLHVISCVFSLLVLRFRHARTVPWIQLAIVLIAAFGARGMAVSYVLALAFVTDGRTLNKLTRRYFRYLIVAVAVVGTFGIVLFRSNQAVEGEAMIHSVLNTFEEGEMFVMVYNYYNGHLLYGQTIADIRYVFIPRQLFPNKPYFWGKARFELDLGLMEIYGNANPLFGASCVFGLLSELFGNFGHVGILVGMFLWGWFYGFMERLRYAPSDSLAWFCYMMLYFSQIWFFRHGLLGAVQGLTVPALIAPIFVFVAYRRTGAPARPFRVRSLVRKSSDSKLKLPPGEPTNY